MSYSIHLVNPVTKETLELDEPHYMRGGTYKLGGDTQCYLNVTYNYSGYYREANEEGIRTIYGMTGAESIPVLHDMIEKIEHKYRSKKGNWEHTEVVENIPYRSDGTTIDPFTENWLEMNDIIWKKEKRLRYEGPNDNYWKPSAANAIAPLYQLIALAQMRPDGIWEGD